ncbi:MAG: GNAT family N-acetyltransferase [Candidatus Staskawiczbacteria bacterium]|nr:GNAT family N-acetyltransferase [Candidatus Staskawiczbacteria bacterium]
MKRKIILNSKNYSLVRLEKSDLAFIKKWRNEQREVLRQNKILSDKDQQVWFKLVQKDKNQKVFSIINSEGELCGYCGITHIDWINKRGELTFLVKTDVQRAEYRKIFLEMLALLKNYFFSNLSLHKFFAETFSFRKFHISILEEFGFKRGGVLIDHVFKKGRFYNSLIHYILC